MNLKIKAAAIVAGFVASSFVGALFCKWITETFTTEQIVQGIAVVSIGALLYGVYSAVLGKLEYDKRAEELDAKYSK
jgi:ABC-type uncharacterized transport system permease subunit